MNNKKIIKKNIEQVLDWYLNAGEVYDTYEAEKNSFKREYCEYYPKCKDNCKDCIFLEEELLAITQKIYDKKLELEELSNEVIKLIERVKIRRRKKRKKKKLT